MKKEHDVNGIRTNIPQMHWPILFSVPLISLYIIRTVLAECDKGYYYSL